MLNIQKIDHIGVRVRERDRSVAFYERLGFRLESEGIFAEGHPVIMSHPCGIVLNVLGPGAGPEGNVLMDEAPKRTGYTHIALRVESLADARAKLKEEGIPETGHLSFGSLEAVFFRDPDGNVIELDDYPGDQPSTRATREL